MSLPFDPVPAEAPADWTDQLPPLCKPETYAEMIERLRIEHGLQPYADSVGEDDSDDLPLAAIQQDPALPRTHGELARRIGIPDRDISREARDRIVQVLDPEEYAKYLQSLEPAADAGCGHCGDRGRGCCRPMNPHTATRA